MLNLDAQVEGPNVGWVGPAMKMNPSHLLQRMLGSEYHEVRLLTLDSLLQWTKQSRGDAYMSHEVQKILFEMIMRENNVECLRQVSHAKPAPPISNQLLFGCIILQSCQPNLSLEQIAHHY